MGHPEDQITDEQVTAATSDGFHTFAELYQHRHALFLTLLANATEDQEPWYTLLHEDGTMFEGYFLAGLDIRVADETWKRITYHLPVEHLEAVERMGHVEKLPEAPPFDGHTSADVVDRLMEGIAFHNERWGIQ
jgi:hypothetical protein